MLSAAAEAELRTVRNLVRGCEKAHGKSQTAAYFSVIGDRLDQFLDQHGEAAWRRSLEGRKHAV